MDSILFIVDAGLVLVAFAAYASLMAAFGSVLAGVRARWERSRGLALVALLAAGATLLLGAVIIIGGLASGAGADASARATLLARTIPEFMNCGALALLGTLIALPAWLFARRRLSTNAK